MTEATDAPQGGADGIVVHESLDTATEVETPTQEIADDTAAQDTGTEETGQADETSEPPAAKKKPWWEKRFDELSADKHAERRRAEAAERRLEALERQATPVEQGPPDRYDDPEGYDRWLINQAKREVMDEVQQTRRLSTYGEKVAKFSETNPDFDELVTSNPDLSITPTMANVIFESDLAPQLAYHLGKNPQEARRIAALSLERQAAELGKLEVTLSQPKAPQTRTPPPPPPQTVAGLSAGLNKTPDSMSMAEYAAWVKKRDAE